MAQVTNTHEIWGHDVTKMPSPFDTLSSKKVNTSSVHATGGGKGKGQSTLVNAIIKAVNEYIEFVEDPIGVVTNAIGEDGSTFVVERKSKTSPDAIHIIRFNSDTGECKGCEYDLVTESIGMYHIRSKTGKGTHDGTAIFLAMMPHILQDSEATEVFNEYRKEFLAGFPAGSTFDEPMGRLCDNIYRRVILGQLKLDLPANTALSKISKTAIETGKVSPKTVLGGNFQVLSVGGTTAYTKAESLKINEGEYHLELCRELKPKEREMIIPIPSTHVVSAEEIRICKEIKRNWKKIGPLRTKVILCEGGAGSGKTQLTRALSYDLGIPYTKITCFADMDKTEVSGCILPIFDEEDLADFPEKDRELLEALYNADEDSIATDVIAEKLGLPSYLDMYYCPAESWKKMTGQECPEKEMIDCINEVARRTTEEWRRLFKAAKAKDNQDKPQVRYRFYESEIVRAFKYGYLLEIQEPTMIRDAGILSQLNSALEPGGAMNLPDGIHYAHPDFICVMTTNRNYAGCKPLNEALRDRVQHAEKMELPSKEVMMERGMAVTGCLNIDLAADFAEAIQVLSETAEKNGIKGVAGMRSYNHWLDAVNEGMDKLEAFRTKVIFKMTTDDDEIAILEDAVTKNTSIFTEIGKWK
jgi:hypothetical protein